MSTLYFRNIPQPIHDGFKSWCAARGESMKDVIIALMEETYNSPTKIILDSTATGRVKITRRVHRKLSDYDH